MKINNVINVKNDNKFENKSAIFKDCIVYIGGKNNSVIIEENCKINKLHITIEGNNHKLIIGKNVKISNNARIKICDSGNTCIIGNDCFINSCCLILEDKNCSIIIGNDCLFANNVMMRTSDGHSIIDLNTKKRINMGGNIKIGNHVWLGYDSKILKNTIIEDNCVVGMNSIVTHNVKANTLVAGIPAKMIRENITWKNERI